MLRDFSSLLEDDMLSNLAFSFEYVKVGGEDNIRVKSDKS